VLREFIDGCSCVPYGAVAVRREVSAGTRVKSIISSRKSEGRSKVRSKTLCVASHSIFLKNIKITHYY